MLLMPSFIIMARNNFTFCLYLCYGILTVKFLLLLSCLDSQKIGERQINGTSIYCKEMNITGWEYFFQLYANDTTVECNMPCSANCTCLLDDDLVISNCTSGQMTTTHVVYISDDIDYLSWANSVLHDIEPETFLRFGRTLKELNLYNISLQHLRQGVFAGLKALQDLSLDNNQLNWIESGTFEELVQLEFLSLQNNLLTVIHSHTFRGLIQLEYLWLDHNMLSCKVEMSWFKGLTSHLTELGLRNNYIEVIEADSYAALPNLIWIRLSNNHISHLAPNLFGGLRHLAGLYIGNNNISTLHVDTFQNLTNLDYLELNNNKLESLPADLFHNLHQLKNLNLSFNNLHFVPSKLLQFCISLETVDLKGNPLLWIRKQSLASLNKSVKLVVSDFATCCFTSSHCISSQPKSPYITCKRLLPYNLLRIAIWFVCSFSILGNAFVFYTRVKKNVQQRNNVQLLIIKNLSISDFIMGLYLISLLLADLYYKDYFPSHSEAWRSSVLCRVAGALSVLSSEASVFFITLITIDRFLGVKYTFSEFRFGIKSARITVALLWMMALGVAITVFVLSQKDSDLYAVSEVCVGLPISRTPFHTVNDTIIHPSSTYSHKISISNYVSLGSRVGMFFSIALFTGFNLVCFFIVCYCYLAIFIYVTQTTKQSGRSPNLNEETRMAMKMFLLVFTDCCCWVPIGILSILVQAGVVKVDPVAYAWIATFVLPINSSINPFLYTLASLISDKVNILRTESSKRQTEKEHVLMKEFPKSENQVRQNQK